MEPVETEEMEIDKDWRWVVVQNIRGKEEIVGQEYAEDGISFIPAFLEKKEAKACQELMALNEAARHEIQAIRIQELMETASRGGFQVFILNGRGEILEKTASGHS